MKLHIASSRFMNRLPNPLHLIFRENRSVDLPVFTQGEMPLPRRLLIAATFRCAAKCPHCYLLQQNKNLFQEQTVMTENLFQGIMDSPFTRNIRSTAFGGGEALLHPALFKWMDQAEERGLPKISTNSPPAHHFAS